jgi:hypothetical protein
MAQTNLPTLTPDTMTPPTHTTDPHLDVLLVALEEIEEQIDSLVLTRREIQEQIAVQQTRLTLGNHRLLSPHFIRRDEPTITCPVDCVTH